MTNEQMRRDVFKAYSECLAKGGTPNEIADRLIASLRAPVEQAPEGFIPVPLNATQEMIKAAEQVDDLYRMGQPQLWARVYRAMIAAAPSAPGREE